MRTCFLTLALLVICTLAMADIGPFTPLGTGHFAGEMASYASGDTIIYVYNSNSSSDPTQTGHIIFKLSTDGGANWTFQEIAEVSNCLTQPSLNVTPGELLISYTTGFTRKLAFSSNGGNQWTIYDAGKTFEPAPISRKWQANIAPLPSIYPSHSTIRTATRFRVNRKTFLACSNLPRKTNR